jgi:glycosyltransferase involved in cell wall biosynthesis
MKISVVIPTYNSSTTIRATIDSVFWQTCQPDEILVLDDGSSDETVSILNSLGSRITILQQEHQGVAAARNALCDRAEGELVAFLDHDDVWHPRYLETQCAQFRKHSSAVALFTGHLDFHGYAAYDWPVGAPTGVYDSELISPLDFLERYNQATGPFASMSYCCVPKRVLVEMGKEPFHSSLSGVDDSYLCSTLPLFGAVAYTPEPLVAYRITNQAQSANRLNSFALWVNVFCVLEERYNQLAASKLRRTFRNAFASKRRQYAKILMAAHRTGEARTQLRYSLDNSDDPRSRMKSLAMLLLTYLPRALQPAWPPTHRTIPEQ